jgi:hypothetical protein
MNSCPMFAYTERDLPRTPAPSRVHALTKPESLMEKENEEEVTSLVSSIYLISKRSLI